MAFPSYNINYEFILMLLFNPHDYVYYGYYVLNLP